MASKAFDAIEGVIASLEKEMELRPVTIVGVQMSPELLSAAGSTALTLVFLTISSATGTSIPAPI
jgi:hypothetical protein